MSRRYHSGHYENWDNAAGSLFALALYLAFIVALILIAAIRFVARTFSRYGKVSKGLWHSLYGGIGLVALSGLLVVLNKDFSGIAEGLCGCAFSQLVIVSIVVNRTYSPTLMKPSINVMEELQKNAFWRKSNGKTSRVA